MQILSSKCLPQDPPQNPLYPTFKIVIFGAKNHVFKTGVGGLFQRPLFTMVYPTFFEDRFRRRKDQFKNWGTPTFF